jgi:hypothetical protein
MDQIRIVSKAERSTITSSDYVESSKDPSFCVPYSPRVQDTSLCSACLSIFEGDLARFESKNANGHGRRPRKFLHHASPKAFKTAAGKGCYICSQFVTKLEELEGVQPEIYDDESEWDMPASKYQLIHGQPISSNGEAELQIYVKFASGISYCLEFVLFNSNCEANKILVELRVY